MASIIPIDTPSLGDRSYLAHDGRDALVVDPQRDIDRVLQLAEAEQVQITHVFETHIHNDYLTGGLALAREVGAAYHVNADDEVRFRRAPIRAGDVVEVSPALRMRAIATPGHTYTHLSYALESDGEQAGVFTGGSLLFGATGRPDLLGDEHTRELARRQYASARRLADELPDPTPVLPTHGFGSFCSAGASSGASASTIGDERRINPALLLDESRWIADLLAGLEAYPAYYAQMSPGNLLGPSAPDLTPPAPVDAEVVAGRIASGEWVVDLRHRTAFAAGHVGGSLNVGLDGQFATYVGWLAPWDTPLTLLGDDPDQIAEAQRELTRIGIDRLHGAAHGRPRDWSTGPLSTFPRADFHDLARARQDRDVTVLDVRRPSEFAASHLEGAVNVPIHEVLDRRDELPGGELWIHCASGYRASIVASLLAAHGHDVVAIDDDFGEHAGASGLALTSAS